MESTILRHTAWILFLPLCVATLSCASRSEADVDRLLRDLDDGRWQVRASAAEDLGRQSAARAIPRLRTALADDSPEVRTAALMSLGRIDARTALDDIRARIREDRDRQVVVHALFALASVPGRRGVELQRDIDLVVEKLSDERERVPSAARRALFQLESRPEIAAMIRADLRSRSAEVRLRASGMAGALSLPELAGWERELLGDRSPEVRNNAYEAVLKDLGRDDVVVLLKGLGDESPSIRVGSAVGLGELRDPAAVPALGRTAGGDPEQEVREAAASALASIAGIPGSALPGLWHYDRIDDRVVLDRDGTCTLTRTFTLAVDGSPEAIRSLPILPPADFPQVDRVLDAGGRSLPFTLEWAGGLRQAVFDVAPIESGSSASFTILAHSRRPVSRKGAEEVVVAYAPGPVQARVRALHVGITSPSGDAAALDRTELAPHDIDEIVVRAALKASDLKLPRPPPRSYSGAQDLTTTAVVVVAILLGLAATIRRLRRTMGERADRAILVSTLTAGALLFLTPILLEDNLPYYALARSAVFDGDLDRANEYTEFNQTQAYAPDNRAQQDPVFASLVRTPILAAAHALTLGRNAISPEHAPNGFSFPYLFLTAVGDFFAVLIGCLACFSLVKRRVGARYALFAVLAVFFGTNLLLFAYSWTGSSFQPSFLLFSVFLNHWDRTRDRRSSAAWLGGGVLLGLLFMTRTLNLGFALIPLLDWSHGALARLKEPDSRGLSKHAGNGALLFAGVVLGFAPQLLVQRMLDHSWFVDAYGVGTGRFSGLRDHVFGLFVSPFDGLLFAMPVLALAFIGLVPLFRIDRWLGTILTATLALQLFAIGSYEFYWGYFLYGTPYLVACTPIFCLAIACLWKVVEARWKGRGAAALFGLAVLFAVRNGWCMLRQLADKMIGDWQSDMGIAQVAHTLLLLDRKLDVNVLRYSSEFGCVLRELVGGFRGGDPERLLSALLWASLVLLPLLVVFFAASRLRRARSRVPTPVRVRAVAGVLGLTWVAAMAWLFAITSHTDLDYGYHADRRTERPREVAIERLEPGQSFTWSFATSNPADRFSVITFLDEAEDVSQGARVATVELTADDKATPFELRAGVDTADFAVDRPESKARRGHTAPLDRASFCWRVRDDSSEFYTARAFRSVFTSPVAARKTSLKVTSSLEHGAIAVVLATVQERKNPRDPSRRRWISDRW